MRYTFCQLLCTATLLLLHTAIAAQRDSVTLNQDAIYNRPFIQLGQMRTAVGGYLEGNTNYFSEDGVSEGFSMEMRRFNVFLYSQVGKRIRFLSELEFEHGTEEIAIETAIIDFALDPALNFRAGILLPAIGLVNTNHDSPNWEFVERPLSSTMLIPTTLSEVGFGFNGKLYPNPQVVLSYDAYVVNGLQDGIVANAEGRTHLASGKSGEMFAEDNNGRPMLNARVAMAHRAWGEVGLSYYGGVYNTFELDGLEVDKKRSLSVAALDFNTSIADLTIQGEAVWVNVDVPQDVIELYGERQFGGFMDLIYPVVKRPILKYEQAVLNLAFRFEYADLNAGQFTTNVETSPIQDENLGLALGVGFRPRPGTVIRANYRYHWVQDALGNPAARVAGIQFGVASYF